MKPATKYDNKPPILKEDCLIHRSGDVGSTASCGCSPLYVWWRYERLPEGCGSTYSCNKIGHCPKCRPFNHNFLTCEKCQGLLEGFEKTVEGL